MSDPEVMTVDACCGGAAPVAPHVTDTTDSPAEEAAPEAAPVAAAPILGRCC